MVSEKLILFLDDVSEELITADHDSPEDCQQICGYFASIRDEARACDLPRIEKAAEAARVLSQKGLIDKEADQKSTIEILNKTVTAFQHLTRPGAQNEDIDLPDDLFADGHQSAAPENIYQLPPYIDKDIFVEFLNNQESVLENIESLLLQLEKEINPSTLAELRRIFHTLKGESAVFEMHEIEKVCHRAEDLIDQGGRNLPVDSLLAVKDWLGNAFDAIQDGKPVSEIDPAVIERLAVDAEAQPEGDSSAAQSVEIKDGPSAGTEEKTADGTEKQYTVPEYLDEDIFHEFLNDQDSVLEDMESHLLSLEKDINMETIADLRRIFHTLKGESAVFGLHNIERVCHKTEDLIDYCGEKPPIDRLLRVKDWIGDVFQALKCNSPMPEFNIEKLSLRTVSDDQQQGETNICEGVQAEYVPADTSVEPDASHDEQPYNEEHEHGSSQQLAAEEDDALPKEQTISADIDLLSDFVSEVQEHIDTIDSTLLSLENSPDNADLLNAVFRVFHTIKGAAGFLALDVISRLAHNTENLLDLARKGELILAGGKIDVVFEAVDEMKKLMSSLQRAIESGNPTYKISPTVASLLGKIQAVTVSPGADIEQSEKPAEESHRATASEAKEQVQESEHLSAAKKTEKEQPADSAVSEKMDEPEAPAHEKTAAEKAPTESEDDETATKDQIQSVAQQQVKAKLKESIKVDSENLDKLIDAIGELVIIEAMIRQDSVIRSANSSHLMRNINQMDKITRELQQLGMALRMIPVKPTFQKMARVVRDLAKKSNKKIEFVVKGEDTMLDKSVVDRIGDPLIHLVRNSVDHGIEATPEERSKAGKSETGTIELTAFHKGGNIHIEIRDDGRGLDKETITKKAIEKKLISEKNSLNDREIYSLIFTPGFSTAKKVTDVSGRGVGMDVVKKTIEDLRGNIEFSSEPGRGSLFSLRLPLTLAIIDGMLVRIGEERYIIPTLSIIESIRPKKQDISTIANKGEMITIRDSLIPLFRLSHLFTIEGAKENPEDGIVIVVEDSGKKTGILVDELLGQQSTVIKSLGAFLKGLPGVSGGSIMSDGRVGIILDVAGIVKLATAGNIREVA